MTYTRIEWTDMVWNPVTGCSPVSEGCQNCYAKRMAQRLRGRFGYPADDPFRVTLHPERLEEPLRLRKPCRIFVSSMGDLFHQDIPDEYILQVAQTMRDAYWHTFLVLTKRPERMRNFWRKVWQEDKQLFLGPGPLGIGFAVPRNIWLGVSVENQATADERIPILLQIPAVVRFVSVEPMLGPVDLEEYLNSSGDDQYHVMPYRPSIDWVVCGGETGPGARPMHPDWVRSLRDQCQAAGVSFFFKCWGKWLPNDLEYNCDNPGANYDVQNAPVGINGCIRKPGDITPGTVIMAKMGKRAAGRLLDGRTWDEFPMEGGEQDG